MAELLVFSTDKVDAAGFVRELGDVCGGVRLIVQDFNTGFIESGLGSLVLFNSASWPELKSALKFINDRHLRSLLVAYSVEGA